MGDVENLHDSGGSPETSGEQSYESYVEWMKRFKEKLLPNLDSIEIVDEGEENTHRGAQISLAGGSIKTGNYRSPGIYVYSGVQRSDNKGEDGVQYSRDFYLTSPDGVMRQGVLRVVKKENELTGVYSLKDVDIFSLELQKKLVHFRDQRLIDLHEKNEIRKQVNPFNPPSF